MNIIDHAPALLIAIPLFTAFLYQFIYYLTHKNTRYLATVSLGITWILAIFMAFRIFSHGAISYTFGATSGGLTLPSGYNFPIRIIFEVDGMSAFMALIGTTVSFVGALYSEAFTRKYGELSKYFSLLLLLTSGLLGMVLTGDLFNFFVFFEIASLSSVALAAYRTYRKESVEAGFKYMLISTVSGILVLVAVGILYGEYGALNIAKVASLIQYTLLDKVALALLVTSFAMKAGSVPMHFWTPDTYGEAPAPITAMLVSASQASLYALFRVVFTLYGLKINALTVGWIIIILGVLSMFIGVTMAIIQKDIKRLMAYHAISQTGYMLLGVGVGLATIGTEAFAKYGFAAMKGGIYHIINHAFYKGLLFLTAGAIFYRTKTRNLNEMGGLAHTMKYTTIFFMIGAAAIAGLPPFNGFASKLLIYESVFKFSPLLSVIAMMVSILTLASFVKVFYSAFLGAKRYDKDGKEFKEVPKDMVIAMGVLAVLIVIFGIFPNFIVSHIVEPAARALSNPLSYINTILGNM